MDPASSTQQITDTNPLQNRNRTRTILTPIFFIVLVCLVVLLYLVNDLFLSIYLKFSCVWSSITVVENSTADNFTIPENSILPADKSKTIGALVESKYPVLGLGKIAVFYSPLDVKGKRIWSQLLFSENNNRSASWIITPFKQNYLYYLNYSNNSSLTQEGYYYFALIKNNRVIGGKTCAVTNKVVETTAIMPKSDILKYVK